MQDRSQSIRVVPLQEEFLDDVVRIHLSGLGYTMNSRLGKEHLALLYRFMARDSQCYAGVALLNGQPVGVVSGTIDAGVLNSKLLKEMPTGKIVLLALRFLAAPWLLYELGKSMIIARPVFHQGKQVSAVLTTLSVDPEVRARGIGTYLVAALERSFAQGGIQSYRLDTVLKNRTAREFYRRLGFCEIGKRADSMVYLKVIVQ